MKKIMMLFVALSVIFGSVAADTLTKKELKQINKEVKAKLKEYKKEKWKIFGSSRTLEGMLSSHYTKLATLGENGIEIVGTANNFKSKNLGRQQATNNACIQYANSAGSALKGRVVADMSANGSNADADSAEEFDHFYGAYERLVEKEIRNEMSESFSLIRDQGNGMFEMQTFFIINEDAASKARLRALENAKKESEAAQRHAGTITDFVRQGFKE